MTDATAPLLKLEMRSQPRLLSAARAMVGNVAGRVGFNETECSQIALAVDEALCNVINHGYGRRPDGLIWITVWAAEAKDATPAVVRVVIEDRADAVDPESIKPRNLDEIRPGGLGVHIIREVMDEVRYERREGGGMRLTMTKRASAERTSAGSTGEAGSPGLRADGANHGSPGLCTGPRATGTEAGATGSENPAKLPASAKDDVETSCEIQP